MKVHLKLDIQQICRGNTRYIRDDTRMADTYHCGYDGLWKSRTAVIRRTKVYKLSNVGPTKCPVHNLRCQYTKRFTKVRQVDERGVDRARTNKLNSTPSPSYCEIRYQLSNVSSDCPLSNVTFHLSRILLCMY